MGWRREGDRPRVALAAFGRATFDLEQAGALLDRSKAELQAQPVDVVAASRLLTDPARAAEFGREAASAGADLIVCQLTTFVDARFAVAVAEAAPELPIVLWAVPESAGVGERLSQNSLTGVNLAGHELWRRGRFFRLVSGDAVGAEITCVARAAAARRWLAGMRVLVVGDHPDGFDFAEPPAGTVHLHRLPLDDLFARAADVPEAAWREVVAAAAQQVRGLDRLPEEQVERFARLQVAVEGEVSASGAGAVAVRCWPEFFTSFGAAACSFVSVLNDRGVAASCEADVLGALTMDLLGRLTGGAPYLGDLAAVDAERGAAVFWHCGAGAFSLASPRTGAVAGVHPNRRLGVTMEFGLKPGRVTVARIGQGRTGLRLLVGGGEALDAPQRFLGTTATVRLDGEEPVAERVRRAVEAGWEPHYALAYGDVRAELRHLGAMLEMPVSEL